jgi:hypothetical protein
VGAVAILKIEVCKCFEKVEGSKLCHELY